MSGSSVVHFHACFFASEDDHSKHVPSTSHDCVAPSGVFVGDGLRVSVRVSIVFASVSIDGVGGSRRLNVVVLEHHFLYISLLSAFERLLHLPVSLSIQLISFDKNYFLRIACPQDDQVSRDALILVHSDDVAHFQILTGLVFKVAIIFEDLVLGIIEITVSLHPLDIIVSFLAHRYN